jgi:hypothetical protein
MGKAVEIVPWAVVGEDWLVRGRNALLQWNFCKYVGVLCSLVDILNNGIGGGEGIAMLSGIDADGFEIGLVTVNPGDWCAISSGLWEGLLSKEGGEGADKGELVMLSISYEIGDIAVGILVMGWGKTGEAAVCVLGMNKWDVWKGNVFS